MNWKSLSHDADLCHGPSSHSTVIFKEYLLDAFVFQALSKIFSFKNPILVAHVLLAE